MNLPLASVIAVKIFVRPCFTLTCTFGAPLEARTVDAPMKSAAQTMERGRYVTADEPIWATKPLAKLKARPPFVTQRRLF